MAATARTETIKLPDYEISEVYTYSRNIDTSVGLFKTNLNEVELNLTPTFSKRNG